MMMIMMICTAAEGAAAAAVPNVADSCATCFDDNDEQIPMPTYAVARKRNTELDSFDMSRHHLLLHTFRILYSFCIILT